MFIRQKHFCLSKLWVFRICHEDIVAYHYRPHPSPTCDDMWISDDLFYGAIYGLGSDGEAKVALQVTGVTQGNVTRAVCRSWDRLSSFMSISQVVVKDVEGGILTWCHGDRVQFSVHIYLSLLPFSLLYQAEVRQNDRYQLIKQTSLFLNQATLPLLVMVSLKAILG